MASLRHTWLAGVALASILLIGASNAHAEINLPVRGVWVSDRGMGNAEVFRLTNGLDQVGPNTYRGRYGYQRFESGLVVDQHQGSFDFIPVNANAGLLVLTADDGRRWVTFDQEDFSDNFMAITGPGGQSVFRRQP